jgi:hypothetical protein
MGRTAHVTAATAASTIAVRAQTDATVGRDRLRGNPTARVVSHVVVPMRTVMHVTGGRLQPHLSSEVLTST